MQAVSSMEPFTLLGQDNQQEIQHDSFGHVMTLSHLFHQDNNNEVPLHFYFGHVICLLLALASCNADSNVNGTTALTNSR